MTLQIKILDISISPRFILSIDEVLPVSIWGHSALDDDDLPRVQASRYGPCVWDHLRWRADVKAPGTCTDTSL